MENVELPRSQARDILGVLESVQQGVTLDLDDLWVVDQAITTLTELLFGDLPEE